jgi:hypothetical protein
MKSAGSKLKTRPYILENIEPANREPRTHYLIVPVAAPSAVPVFCTRSNVTAAS